MTFASNSNATIAFNGVSGYAGDYACGGRINSLYRSDCYSSIQYVQWKLGVNVDSLFGRPQTSATVISYQTKHGRVVDGVVGHSTASSMWLGSISSPIINSDCSSTTKSLI